MLYFSYGSNMSSRRLRARTPSAAFVTTARLVGYGLRFHKRGLGDGTGKCDIVDTGEAADIVHGVVFRIDAAEIAALDRAEGLGKGYDKKQISLIAADGEALSAFTYVATEIDPALAPLCWYKEHVLRGAEEHGLPEVYVRAIRAVIHEDDADAARRARELSVYRDGF